MELDTEISGDSEEVPSGTKGVPELPDAKILATDLKASRLQVVTIVEKLGPFLTSSDAEDRIRGAKVFNDVLSSLSDDFLSETQLNSIAAFYASRLNDNHKVVPSIIEGILTMIKMKHLTTEISQTLLKSLFDNVPCQQQVRTDRNNIYTILHFMIVNRIEDVKSMGAEFTLGLIFAMDGERDPRNLLFLFSILPPFLRAVTLGHVAEDMFEVMACYFPVDFNAQQDDVNAITRDGLAEKLSICLCANPSFAENCIPLLLEKLDSNLKVAKLDSLKLLILSCSTFPPKSYVCKLDSLWQALFREMSQESDAELQKYAHISVSELISHFSKETTLSSVCQGFLKQIQTTIQCQLIESKTRSKYELFLRIFLTVARASEASCIFVMENMNSILTTQYSLTSDDAIKTAILNYFISAFQICKHFKIVSNCIEQFRYIGEMVEIATKSQQMDLRLSGFKCLSVIAELISPKESMMFLEILRHNVDHEKIQVVADATKTSLLSMALQQPSNIKSYVEELCMLDSVVDSAFILNRRLDVLCSLISVSDYTNVVLDKLITLMNSEDLVITYSMIKVLSDVIQSKELFNDEKLQEIQTKYDIVRSISLFVDRVSAEISEQQLEYISIIIITIMKAQKSDEQLKLYSIMIPKYLDQISHDNNVSIVMLEALLNSSRQDLSINCLGDVIVGALNYALTHQNSFVQVKACTLIVNILNKYINHEGVLVKYENMKNVLTDKVRNDSIEPNGLNVIVLMAWLTKSLFLSGHTDATYWLLLLIELLNTEKWGLEAAKHFKLIMMESKETLNSDCFCKANFFYRQKIFQIFLSRMCDNEIKLNESHFLALAYIIQFIPRSVLLMELPKISPIMMDCLNFNEPELIQAVLDTTVFLIENKKLSTGIQTILQRCLKLSDRTNPIKIRIASLQCLFSIANNYPTVELLHFKQDVILELAKRLDDPKRLVRSTAVKARTRWFLVGSPGEDKDK